VEQERLTILTGLEKKVAVDEERLTTLRKSIEEKSVEVKVLANFNEDIAKPPDEEGWKNPALVAKYQAEADAQKMRLQVQTMKLNLATAELDSYTKQLLELERTYQQCSAELRQYKLHG